EDRRVAAAAVVLAAVARRPFRVVLVVLVGVGGGALEARGVAAARREMLAAHRAATVRAVPRLGVVAIAEREQTALSHARHRRLLTRGLGLLVQTGNHIDDLVGRDRIDRGELPLRFAVHRLLLGVALDAVGLRAQG